jgi:hypothetical protein
MSRTTTHVLLLAICLLAPILYYSALASFQFRTFASSPIVGIFIAIVCFSTAGWILRSLTLPTRRELPTDMWKNILLLLLGYLLPLLYAFIISNLPDFPLSEELFIQLLVYFIGFLTGGWHVRMAKEKSAYKRFLAT